MSVTKFLVWPQGQESKAEAYKTQADAEYVTISGEPDAVFTLINTDRHGQPFCAALMPPYEFIAGTPLVEPASLVPLRTDAVELDEPEWPLLGNL